MARPPTHCAAELILTFGLIALLSICVAWLVGCGHLVGLLINHFGFGRTLNLAVTSVDVSGELFVNHFGFGQSGAARFSGFF